MKQQNKKDYDLLLKIILEGDSGTQKNKIIQKFMQEIVTQSNDRWIDLGPLCKVIEIQGKTVLLQINNINKYGGYKSAYKSFYSKAYGAMIVYDITNKKSFENVEKIWKYRIRMHAKENIQMMLIGSKCDLENERKISKKSGKKLADKLGIPFYEVSVKENINIEDAFTELTMNILDNLDENNQLKPKPKSKPIIYSIQEDMKQLFERKELCDFEIECKDDQNPLSKFKIPVHKLIIQNRLRIDENQLENQFYSILSRDSKQNVDVLLKWIYFGKVLLSNLSIFEEWKKKLSNISKVKIKIGINPLLDDLKRLMNEEETKDFQIISNNQKIKIHKIILIARSELFRGMFISVTEDKSNSVHEYSNKKTKTIQNLINFFYTDEIPKIKNKTILKELKECVDYFQLNSKRLNQLIKKIIGEIPQQQQQQQNSKKKCLIF
ncbi:small gtp binding protein rab8 [Anaeramoeba ignava]|uniref:Small gtp binding protein rab8 n=1 Tax=Anaeramoeba ignava TaxID=1746090 RepID=A0A9Q0RC13_ANAIG|nr:small gtp binding protein rab8 [Anaeramoeba ignava]